MAIEKVVSKAVGMLPLERGCCCLTIFETFMIMIGFASLIVAILTFGQKK
ncbi:putative holin-like toxin [Bacillus sp. 7884-1]